MAKGTLLDLDSALGESLDNVEAAPEFITPPNGKYKLRVVSAKISSKDVVDADTGEEVSKSSINIVYGVVETVEIADGEVPAPNGSLFSERFQLTQESLPYLKTRLVKILGEEMLKGVSLKDALDGLKDAPPFDCAVRVKITKSKGADGKMQEFENIQLNFAAAA